MGEIPAHRGATQRAGPSTAPLAVLAIGELHATCGWLTDVPDFARTNAFFIASGRGLELGRSARAA
jgi:hypothetical protein